MAPDSVSDPPRLDRAGRPLTRRYGSLPRPVANKGKRFPPNPPSPEAILHAIATLSNTPQDRRLVALIAVLWRAGLTISEALRLDDDDLNADRGVVLVRDGRPTQRRDAAMDSWGFERVAHWQEIRSGLPPGPLFCILRGPTAGLAWGAAGVRHDMQRLGVPQLRPMQLRYAHVAELHAEGVSPAEIYRQLGVDTKRNNRLPAIPALNSRTPAEGLRAPGAAKSLGRAKGTPPGEAYSLVRRAAQAVDHAHGQARTRSARRAWAEAQEALYIAEEKIMHAAAEDFGEAA